MSEELGKIEKPLAESFKAGRKLYFVPLVFSKPDLPLDMSLKFSEYWDQVESQIANLESKLGQVKYILHELVYASGEVGLKTLEQVNSGSLDLVRNRLEKGTVFEPAEDNEIMTELMDWSRCLSLGLQNQKVFSNIYQNYTDANSRRNTFISQKLDKLVKGDESCILIMAEGHHVQFPADMQVFYVAPPVLDFIKRWTRDQEAKERQNQAEQENNQAPPQ
jgi:hypothetical protein